MRCILLFVLLVLFCSAQAQHVAKLEITELEWNGKVKTLNPAKKFEFKFTEKTDKFFIDSIGQVPIFGQLIYLPIYNDTSDRPGFEFRIVDIEKPDLDVITRTDYKAGKYDAGIKVKDMHGQRRWAGKLKYTPDTSVHLPRPTWRNDNFTLQIETFRAWNSQVSINGNKNNKVMKELYFQGTTGVKSDVRSGGRYGEENFYMQLEPIRYQWGSDVWMEMLIHLYKKQTDGQYLEILAHAFKSTDKNIFYNGVRKQNAYEVRDAKEKYYMMFTGVLIIPY